MNNDLEKLSDVELAEKAGISIHAVKQRRAAGETAEMIINVQNKKRETKVANKARSKAKGKVRIQRQKTRKKRATKKI